MADGKHIGRRTAIIALALACMAIIVALLPHAGVERRDDDMPGSGSGEPQGSYVSVSEDGVGTIDVPKGWHDSSTVNGTPRDEEPKVPKNRPTVEQMEEDGYTPEEAALLANSKLDDAAKVAEQVRQSYLKQGWSDKDARLMAADFAYDGAYGVVYEPSDYGIWYEDESGDSEIYVMERERNGITADDLVRNLKENGYDPKVDTIELAGDDDAKRVSWSDEAQSYVQYEFTVGVKRMTARTRARTAQEAAELGKRFEDGYVPDTRRERD